MTPFHDKQQKTGKPTNPRNRKMGRWYDSGHVENALVGEGVVSYMSNANPVADAFLASCEIYKAYCLACHDADGGGRIVGAALGAMPDFTAGKWQAGHGDSELKQSILNGKGKFMLPIKDKLSDEDAEKMTAFVRAFREWRQLVAVQPARRHACHSRFCETKLARKPDRAAASSEYPRRQRIIDARFPWPRQRRAGS